MNFENRMKVAVFRSAIFVISLSSQIGFQADKCIFSYKLIALQKVDSFNQIIDHSILTIQKYISENS